MSLGVVRRAVRSALADIAPGRLVVGVSGGADSLALLAATVRESTGRGHLVTAVTVDHGLQDGSAALAARVAATARTIGATDAEVVQVQVRPDGTGPEAAARLARHRALTEVADRVGAMAVLLGHTLDDQAETVLLGLARGSGARSLSGMARVSGVAVRPLLGVRRADTEAACAELGLEPWTDPHNTDPAFTRARVRADLMPVLAATLGPGAVAALARSADLLRADAAALDAWAVEAAVSVRDDEGLAVERLAALPDAVRSRVLRAAAVEAGSPPGSLTAAHVAAVDALVTDWRGQGAVALPGPVSALRDCGRLHLAEGAAAGGVSPGQQRPPSGTRPAGTSGR